MNMQTTNTTRTLHVNILSHTLPQLAELAAQWMLKSESPIYPLNVVNAGEGLWLKQELLQETPG